MDYIATTGTIIEAVDNQPWSGEANVHVSIVNWIKSKDPILLPKSRRLWSTVGTHQTKSRRQPDLVFSEGAAITSALTLGADMSGKRPLRCNIEPKRCFQGKIPGYEGFMVTEAELPSVSDSPTSVAAPYLTGRELLGEWVISRWAIDFRNLPMHEAARYPNAFDHCRQHVLPQVEAKLREAEAKNSDMAGSRREHLSRWWQFWNRRDELNSALSVMTRYIGCSRVTRRPVMVFLSAHICPSDLVQVFAFDDDYSFGILQSALHFEWFKTSSRMKVESDLRYSVRDVYETFPWPQQPSSKSVLAVAEAGRTLRATRQTLLKEMKGGLRALYRLIELPGNNILKDAHSNLETAVLACYGFSSRKDMLEQLLGLNADVAARIDRGDTVTSPGPPDPTMRDQLLTADCMS